jgi:hypothetical protein
VIGCQENGMNNWQTPAALLVGHRRARAVVDPPHVLPELFDVVRGGHAVEPRLDLSRQRFIGQVHIGELGAAKRLAVAMRDADAIQYIYKTGHLPIGHIRMPILAGIRTADVFAVLLEVREDVDLGILLARVAPAGGGTLDLPEPLRKALQSSKVEMLVRKPQHAVPAEREQYLRHVLLAQGLCQVDPANRCPENRTRRFNRHHVMPPSA